MLAPHGRRLVDRTLKGEKLERALEEAGGMPSLEISLELVRECENIASGEFSPLTGFMGREDYEEVLDHMRLSSDLPWTIPIVLHTERERTDGFGDGREIVLTHEGRPVALMEVEESFPLDRKRHALGVYGTDDPDHPGVAKTNSMGGLLLGGEIRLLTQTESVFPQYHLRPIETRILFKEKGWRTVVGFQTRNVPHMGHEYLQKTSLSFTDGLLINPVIGRKKPGDFKDEVIIKAYQSLIENYYLRERAVLVTLQLDMRYAGPREAIFHSIVRKNYGCTHFIVGRDHAGVGNYYEPYAAHEIFENFPDLGISPLFFTSFFHCKRCGGVANDKTCPHPDSDHESFSGTRIRSLLTSGKRPPQEIMRPEIADIVLGWEEPFVA